YLFAHGANHAWLRLKWLMDIAAFISKLEPADWDAISQGSREWGLGRNVAQGLMICNILLKTPVPETPGIPETTYGFAALHLCKQPLEELVKSNHRNKTDEKFHALKHARYRMKLKEEWPFKRDILKQLFLGSSVKDDQQSPRGMSFLRYLTKPASWFFRKFIRRGTGKKKVEADR
ncbi:MAG: nucleotidyltransferase family protein, partial [Pseudomonadales bacterium]|nr:nucleotidyltransferase family protein [Pseudomonadales bacterium]